MAGYGRRKPTTSFNIDLLDVNKEETALLPSQVYPIQDLHILNFESTNELDYLVELKRDFAEYMRDSVHNVLPDVQKKDIERYSDHYQDTITDNPEHKSKYDWSRMPKELTLLLKRKKATKNLRKNSSKQVMPEPKRKKLKIIDDDDEDNDVQSTEVKLKQQKSKQVQDNMGKEVEAEEEENETEDEDDENSEEEIEEYEEVDKEMDDGTDYVNNYFDNGETFDDDEDNLDDAIY